MNKSLMTRVNYYMPNVMIKSLKKLAKKMGISVSEIIRRAVDEFLKEK